MGWKELPKKKGEGYQNFKNLFAALQPSHEYNLHETDDWLEHGLETENQQSIRIIEQNISKKMEC